MGANDRYPVPISDPFVRYEERIKALERRAAEQSGARPLQHTALTGGRVKVIDPDSTDAVVVGMIGTDEGIDRYGLQLSGGGAVVFEVNSIDGWRQPAFALAAVPQKALGSGAYVNTTSATFESCYKIVGDATHRAITVVAIVTCAASTTAEVRVRHGGGTVTGLVSCPAASQVTATFRWLHDQTIGSGPHTFDYQARRASGSGSVQVYWPEYVAMTNADYATAGGLP